MTTSPILDHGYVKLIETWGSDERIIEAARMSVQKGFNGWGPIYVCPDHGPIEEKRTNHTCRECGNVPEAKPGDEKLLRFLYENNHATPFEMGGLIIEVQAPIFVFREWHRHRTQSYNEASARYAPLPAFDYVPTIERTMINAGGTNRQAGTVAGADTLTETQAVLWLEELAEVQAHAERVYQHGLSIGVPKELARLSMTVGRYSKMRASANLRNWIGFLALRMESKAQWEIRQYSNAVADLVRDAFPRTYSLFMENR